MLSTTIFLTNRIITSTEADVPEEPGKTGVCISIVNLKEKSRIRQLEKQVGKEFNQSKIPSGTQVCEQLYHLIDRMENVVVNEEEIMPFLPVIFKKLQWLNNEELIKRFVSVEFNRFLEYYRNAGDLNVDELKEIILLKGKFHLALYEHRPQGWYLTSEIAWTHQRLHQEKRPQNR